MTTVAKDIKQHSKDIDVNSIEELKLIAVRYATVKDYVFSRYSGINSLMLLENHRKQIRDIWVKSKFAEQWKLPSRYWKLALEEAISNIKSEWSNTKNRVKDAVSLNSNITEDEKKFIYYALKASSILQSILTYKEFEKTNEIMELNIREKYVLNLIRRYIRKYKGNIPYSKKKRSFMIDAPMYKYKNIHGNNTIEITGIKKNQRVRVALRDKNLHSGNLRLVIEDNNLVVIHRLKQIKVKENLNETNIVGIDKGYVDLFTTSSGNFYGRNLSNLLSSETERLNSINAKRNKIWALMNKCTQEGNFKKAEIIRKNNFGKVKYNRHKHKYDELVKSYINNQIKIMFDTEKPTEIVLENLDFQSINKKLPKHIKRKLCRWIKGYIENRLEYIATLKNIKVNKINPAYTSQVCHKCGTLGFRDNKIFKCENCGTMDADYNAACNIKLRKFDSEITLYTPYKKVKEIILSKYNVKIAN